MNGKVLLSLYFFSTKIVKVSFISRAFFGTTFLPEVVPCSEVFCVFYAALSHFQTLILTYTILLHFLQLSTSVVLLLVEMAKMIIFPVLVTSSPHKLGHSFMPPIYQVT